MLLVLTASCNKHDEDLPSQESKIELINTFRTLFLEKSAKAEYLRNLNTENTLCIGFESTAIKWHLAQEDKSDEEVCIIIPLQSDNIKLLIDSSISGSQIRQYKSKLAPTFLIGIRSRTSQESNFYFMQYNPTPEWIQKHPEGIEVGGLLPTDYTGLIFCVDLSGNLRSVTSVSNGSINAVKNTISKVESLRALNQEQECFTVYIGKECWTEVETIPSKDIHTLPETIVISKCRPLYEQICFNLSTQAIVNTNNPRLWSFLNPGESLIRKSFSKQDSILISKKCAELKLLLQDPNSKIKQKVDSIRNNLITNPNIETGVLETSENIFIDLSSINPHSLSTNVQLPNGVYTKGYIHSHQPSANLDEIDYNISVDIPIQVFSHQDLVQFNMLLQKVAQPKNNISPKEIYSILVTQEYTYILSVELDKPQTLQTLIHSDRYKDINNKDAYLLIMRKPSNPFKQFSLFIQQYYPVDGLIFQRYNNSTGEVDSKIFRVDIDTKKQEIVNYINSNC